MIFWKSIRYLHASMEMRIFLKSGSSSSHAEPKNILLEVYKSGVLEL